MVWANTANAGFNAGTSECRSTRRQQSNPLQPGNAFGCLLQAPISKMFQSFPVTLGLLDRALTQHKWLSLEVQRRQMVAVMSSVIQLFLEELLWCCVLLYKHDLEITGLRFRQSACVSFLCATEHVSVPSWGQPLWTGVYLGA